MSDPENKAAGLEGEFLRLISDALRRGLDRKTIDKAYRKVWKAKPGHPKRDLWTDPEIEYLRAMLILKKKCPEKSFFTIAKQVIETKWPAATYPEHNKAYAQTLQRKMIDYVGVDGNHPKDLRALILHPGIQKATTPLKVPDGLVFDFAELLARHQERKGKITSQKLL